ncbi:hypothetical protein CRENBAI_023336 [Crenichthys baileyi]|uniref:Uncharacterized protein n=1 Tax=Crenichthys baileyi TaxID=28760 RepID=A0AAV9SH64_9TELE
MTQFKEKLRAIQDDDKESLLEECGEYGRLEQTKDHRTDSEVPIYDLTAETETEEEGNESEQEQDQRHAELSQGPTITPYIVRQKGDIPQRIAQTKAEIQETIKKEILLSAALERHTRALKRMTYTPSHREQDPTQSKGACLLHRTCVGVEGNSVKLDGTDPATHIVCVPRLSHKTIYQTREPDDTHEGDRHTLYFSKGTISTEYEPIACSGAYKHVRYEQLHGETERITSASVQGPTPVEDDIKESTRKTKRVVRQHDVGWPKHKCVWAP